jgi:hypothetical protein
VFAYAGMRSLLFGLGFGLRLMPLVGFDRRANRVTPFTSELSILCPEEKTVVKSTEKRIRLLESYKAHRGLLGEINPTFDASMILLYTTSASAPEVLDNLYLPSYLKRSAASFLN